MLSDPRPVESLRPLLANPLDEFPNGLSRSAYRTLAPSLTESRGDPGPSRGRALADELALERRDRGEAVVCELPRARSGIESLFGAHAPDVGLVAQFKNGRTSGTLVPRRSSPSWRRHRGRPRRSPLGAGRTRCGPPRSPGGSRALRGDPRRYGAIVCDAGPSAAFEREGSEGDPPRRTGIGHLGFGSFGGGPDGRIRAPRGKPIERLSGGGALGS